MTSLAQVLVIAAQKLVGTAFNTYTTAKSVLNADAKITLPRNSLYAGKRLRITVLMGISNVVTAQPTFTFQVMIGSVIAWSSGAVTCTTTAHTKYPAKLVIDLRVDSEGSGTVAKVVGVGILTGKMFEVTGALADSGVTDATIALPAATVAVGTGFDSSIDNVLDFFVGISASNAANGVQVFSYYVEDLSPIQ